MRFQVTQVNTVNPRLEFPELRDRKLDVVLARVVETFDTFQHAEDLSIEKLLDDHLIIVAGTSSPWAAKRRIDLLELEEAPWILPHNSWNSGRIQEAFRKRGKPMPQVILDTFSHALRTQMLLTGRFVAAIPASTLGPEDTVGSLKVLPVALPDKPWPVAMITLKDRTLSPAARQFVESARTVAKTMPLGRGKTGAGQNCKPNRRR